MRIGLSLLFALAFAFVAGGCDDDSANASHDAGDSDADAGGHDGGDMDADVDASDPCAEGASATIGVAGGELSWCGAKLIVPPDFLIEDVKFTIEPAEVPEPNPPFVLAGRAFAFLTDAVLPGPIEVELPHDAGTHRVELRQLVDTVLEGFEACRVEDTVIAQFVGLPGTYVAVMDPNVYPSGPSGLGTGSITYEYDSNNYVGTVSAGGYIIDEGFGDERSITATLRDGDEEGFVQIDIRFAIDAQGDATLVQVAWADTHTLETSNWVSAIHPAEEGILDITSDDGSTVAGTITATLYFGEETFPFSGTFEVTPEPYRYPPELYCPGGPEGDGPLP